MEKFDAPKYARWLQSYAKKKVVRNYGGNFWGFSRSRCTIITPDMLDSLVAGDFIALNGSSFTVNGEKK